MNELISVNKIKGLDKAYVPNDLIKVYEYTDFYKKIYMNKTAYKKALKLLKKASKKLKIKVIIESSYRDYYYQEKLFSKELEKKSKEEVLKSVAPPGHSEHQTGLAMDIGFIINGENIFNFDTTKYQEEYIYLHKIIHKYGFILRYPLGKEDITGYNYEPWHFRYVGKKHAKKIKKKNITLEEYLK